MRIVSLLPSATEIVCALGLESALVGVTHECDHPPAVARLPKVTRTLIPHDAASAEIDALVRERLKTQQALYTLDRPALEALAPDLLVTQALCDVCAVADAEVREAACALPGPPRVVNLEPTCLETIWLCPSDHDRNDLGTDQQDQPGQVEPDHQHDHATERAIRRPVVGDPAGWRADLFCRAHRIIITRSTRKVSDRGRGSRFASGGQAGRPVLPFQDEIDGVAQGFRHRRIEGGPFAQQGVRAELA